MVGQLVREEADLSTSGLGHTANRAEAIDYTSGITLSESTIAIDNPEAATDELKSTVDFAGFVKVFSPHSWLTIFLSVLVAAAVHFVIVASVDRNGRGAGGTILHRLAQGLAVAYKALLQIDSGVGGCGIGERLSFKIFVITTSFTFLVLFAFFTGDITAQMTVRRPPHTLRNFQDVLNAGHSVVVQPGSSHEYYLKTSKDPAAAKLYQEILDKDYYGLTLRDFRPDKGHKAVKLGRAIAENNAVFLTSRFVFLSKDRAGTMIPVRNFENAVRTHVPFALRKESEFLRLFNHHLSVMRQSGLLGKIYRRWIEREPEDETGKIFISDAAALEADNLYFPVTVISVGVASGLTLMVLEVFLGKVARVLLLRKNAKS